MTSHPHLIGDCKIHRSATICHGAIIGKPFRVLLDGAQENLLTTRVGANAYIGYYSIIGTGSKVGNRTIIDDRCTIESRVALGKDNLVIYSAHLCNDVSVGDGCVIGGLIGERTIVGNRCRIFGKIVHSQHNPLKGWDDEDSMEPSPVVEDEVFIGFGAVLSGAIKLGRRAYVVSGAIITKDIPSFHIAFGVNKVRHFSEWKGKLAQSKFFQDK